MEKTMNAEASSILLVDDEELNSEGLARRGVATPRGMTISRSCLSNEQTQ
jgi:hypothetical protein